LWRGGVLLAVWVLAPPAALAATSCADLTHLTLPDVRIESANTVPAGEFAPPGPQRPVKVGEFCRVLGTATPTSDSDIHFEVWIPAGEGWNHKLLGTGNGGFAGAIGYAALASGLARGYAVTGTDTGHTGDQMEFGRGHPEKIVDWSYRAVHVTTEAAKVIIRDLRGELPVHSYFQGCSTGGQQALSEAQRFPDDYDGILAGAPGNDRIRLIIGFLWSWIATHTPSGDPLLSHVQLARLTRAAIAQCDTLDGSRDGLIADPRRCDFDPAVLACGAAPTDNTCLNAEQIDAVRKVYAGPRNPRTGVQLFPGWARGSESGWGPYILDPKEPVRLGLFRDFAFGDPAWDWRTFDWDRDVRFIETRLPYLSAMSTDLSSFKSRGGKLLMYTGWADPVVPPADVASYYDAVVQAMGGLRKTRDFFRFFGVPGMGHCGGGYGPEMVDPMSALEAWVEHGQAPEQITAAERITAPPVDSGGPPRSRGR
jgi:feruloyl esterase